MQSLLKIFLASKVLFLLTVSFYGHASPVIYDGVTFPQGDISFIDEVISYTPGPDVQTNSIYDQPNNVLGAPDGGGVSIGDGGELVLRFIDNVLIADGTSAEDLWIFEIGPAVEWFNMEISVDGSDWIFVGTVRGQPSGIDIDATNEVSVDDEYSWLRVTDDITRNNSGFPFGEGDFDAIGAISSMAPTTPEPSDVNSPAMSSWLIVSLFLLFSCRKSRTFYRPSH